MSLRPSWKKYLFDLPQDPQTHFKPSWKTWWCQRATICSTSKNLKRRDLFTKMPKNMTNQNNEKPIKLKIYESWFSLICISYLFTFYPKFKSVSSWIIINLQKQIRIQFEKCPAIHTQFLFWVFRTPDRGKTFLPKTPFCPGTHHSITKIPWSHPILTFLKNKNPEILIRSIPGQARTIWIYLPAPKPTNFLSVFQENKSKKSPAMCISVHKTTIVPRKMPTLLRQGNKMN